jgi:hypothetical protein
MQEYKIDDVFSFRWKDNVSTNYFGDLYHCFDGQLIVCERGGEMYLRDTYWSSGTEGKGFTIEEANERGILTYKCNLDEVDIIRESDLVYYADSDVFNLSTQHGCYPRYAKRRNATRSQEKILSVLKSKIEDTQREIEFKKRSLQQMNERLQKLEAGDTTIFI